MVNYLTNLTAAGTVGLSVDEHEYFELRQFDGQHFGQDTIFYIFFLSSLYLLYDFYNKYKIYNAAVFRFDWRLSHSRFFAHLFHVTQQVINNALANCISATEKNYQFWQKFNDGLLQNLQAEVMSLIGLLHTDYDQLQNHILCSQIKFKNLLFYLLSTVPITTWASFFILAYRTARSLHRLYCHHNVVCLSVRLSVTLCIVAKRYILRQKVSERVNRKCPPRNTTAQLSTLYTNHEPSKSKKK